TDTSPSAFARAATLRGPPGSTRSSREPRADRRRRAAVARRDGPPRCGCLARVRETPPRTRRARAVGPDARPDHPRTRLPRQDPLVCARAPIRLRAGDACNARRDRRPRRLDTPTDRLLGGRGASFRLFALAFMIVGVVLHLRVMHVFLVQKTLV